MARFIQLHTLTAYPASLLNRDDAGYAKRLPFGGATRTRISSQCLKKHWRDSDGPHQIKTIAAETVRSRQVFDHHVRAPLAKAGVDDDLAFAVAAALQKLVIGESSKRAKAAKTEEAKQADKVTTSQVVVLGMPEISYLKTLADEIVALDGITAKTAEKCAKEHLKAREMKKNLNALKMASGLNAALFGRMVTGDALSHMDAAIHVAHAFTVHAEASEPDYFTVVDELTKDAGTGHVNTAELTSGLYYSYVVIDVPLLVSNLGNDAELAAQVVSRFVHLMCTQSPGAKKGATAPYSRASLLLTEIGDDQPRTLANAFLQPVHGDDLLGAAYGAIAGHLGELDGMYDERTDRRFAGLGPVETFGDLAGERGTVGELASALATLTAATPVKE